MSARTPEQKAAAAAKQRARYAANPELYKERNHRYYMAHQEGRIEDARAWYADPENRERRRTRSRQHRLDNLVSTPRPRCYFCSKPARLLPVCGRPMRQTGEPCARRRGHGLEHRSAYAVGNARAARTGRAA